MGTQLKWMGTALALVFTGLAVQAQTNTFPASGNVGIGTTSPTNLLNVNGAFGIGSGNNDTVFTPGSSSPLTVSAGYGLNFTYYNNTAGKFLTGIYLTGQGTNQGYVGIGTIPAYQLDVAGQIRSSSGGIVFPDGTTQNTAFIPGTGLNLPDGITVNSTTGGQITEYLKGSSSGDANLVLQAGNGNGSAFWLTATTSVLEIGGTGGSEPSLGAIDVAANGYVGIGTTIPGQQLEVAGYIQADKGIYFPGYTTAQTTPWTSVLCGGDYAEAVNAAGSRKAYEPGDVLVIGDGAEGEVQKSAEPYSTMVAGIFATKPGVIGRRQSLSKEADEIPMAMIGIVPTKVTGENGPIHRGDLLVTSSTTGYAMKGTDRNRLVGAVIGKAMGSLETGTGVIEVLVTLQ
jgi:hypothetical protein